jgi:DNA-binding CsgD family transcriptional regulator
MDFDEVVAIGSQLSQLPDRAAYRIAAREQLLRLVPSDDALWIQATDRFGSGCVAVRGDPFEIDQRLSGDLTRYWTRHVTPRWQTAHPYERTPFRVSDIIAPSRWRQHEVFDELKYAMPEYQLNIAPPPPARYRCWLLARRGRDFSDADREVAVGIAPVLAALGLMYDRLQPWHEVASRSTNQADLTARELGVLTALAEGLPAAAIGRRLGISVGTVDKHLEHIYRKLGCRDRLIAVTIARQLDLLPMPSASISHNGGAAQFHGRGALPRTQAS